MILSRVISRYWRVESWTTPLMQCAAWLAWGALAGAISVGLAINPFRHSVFPIYYLAALRWIRGEPLYTEAPDGWLYPPQSVQLFAPFTLLRHAGASILWRWVIVALFAWSVWRLGRAMALEAGRSLFPLITAIVMPLSLPALQNGQTTVPLAACLLHATVDLMDRRLTRAALALTLAMFFKPVAIVMILLVVGVYPAIWWRLAIGAGVYVAAGMMHPDFGYALESCRQGVRKVIEVTTPDTGRFADLAGALAQVGVRVPDAVAVVARAAAAVGTLLAARWLVARRGPVRGAFFVYALAAAYIVLFNPRTESNTYCMLAAAMAGLGILYRAKPERAGHAATILAMCVVMFATSLFTRVGIDRVVRPVLAGVFVVMVLGEGRRLWTDSGNQAR